MKTSGSRHQQVLPPLSRRELLRRLALLGVAAGGFGPALSYDGRFVAFVSDSDALVFDDHNGHADVFVFDRALDAAEVTTLFAL